MEIQAKTLRKFHNFVKYQLLEKYCSKSKLLLDVGCGRGGDMHKWEKLGIQRVIGIDVNRNYVLDAIRRFKNTNFNARCDYNFYFTRPQYIFNEFFRYKNLPLSYDNISCMFALHYFFENEYCVLKIFEQISHALKNGGYFVGTVMNGNVVSKLIEHTEVFTTNALFVKKEYTEIRNTGSKISFMLSGTLYFGEKTLSTEYLVLEDALKHYGRLFHLDLIEFECFSNYFYDEYDLNEDFKQASFLNYIFAFQKLAT